jgi:hypothetical protein
MDMNLDPAFWQRKPCRPTDRYLIGVDLGQSQDYTAISVLRHQIIALGTVTSDVEKQVHIHDSVERYDIVKLERLRLGMPYTDQVEYIRQLMLRPPLDRAKLIVDETGVGRPVSDMFDLVGLKPERIAFTDGREAKQAGNRSWHVPKHILVSTLQANMNLKTLKIAPTILESGALKEELADFERHVTASGRATFGGRTEHDDLVMSVAIVLWTAIRTAKPSVEVGPLPQNVPLGQPWLPYSSGA